MTTATELHQRVRALIVAALRIDENSTEEIAKGIHPAWDSLRHIEVIFAIEDAFEVRFDASEFPTLTDVPAIAASIMRHREA